MIISVYHKVRMWGWKGVVDYFNRMFQRWRIQAYFHRNAKRFKLTPTKGITLVGDLTGAPSLCKSMRDFAWMLKKSGIPYQTFDLGQQLGRVPSADYEGLLTPLRDFRILKYDHFVEMFGGPFPAGLPLKRSRIVFWEFESGLMEYYPAIAEGVDEIVGMSDFDVEIFRKQLPKGTPVSKILYPFLFDVGDLPSAEDVRTKYGVGLDDFVVFFNFDFGSSYGRKNPDGVLRAFAGAFAGVPKTRLVFKTKGAKSHVEDYGKLQRLAEELGVLQQLIFIDTFIPMKDIYGLTNACDAYISLHRGEGFGLGVAEAMSLGKPVIVTDYSGTTEFCNAETAIPIPYELVKVPEDENDHVCYRAVTHWAEPDVKAATKALVRLYEDPELRTSIGLAAKKFIAEHFSVSNFRDSVEELLA